MTAVLGGDPFIRAVCPCCQQTVSAYRPLRRVTGVTTGSYVFIKHRRPSGPLARLVAAFTPWGASPTCDGSGAPVPPEAVSR